MSIATPTPNRPIVHLLGLHLRSLPHSLTHCHTVGLPAQQQMNKNTITVCIYHKLCAMIRSRNLPPASTVVEHYATSTNSTICQLIIIISLRSPAEISGSVHPIAVGFSQTATPIPPVPAGHTYHTVLYLILTC